MIEAIGLSLQERRTVAYQLSDRLGYADIAEMDQIKVKSVRMRKYRARRRARAVGVDIPTRPR